MVVPARADVGIRPYGSGDLPLLARLLGDPAMTAHLGGPDSAEAIRARHERYLRADGAAEAPFAVVAGPQRTAVGWVGWWELEWRGAPVWECGWSVLPEHQGAGVATAAMVLLLARLRARGGRRAVHAFPAVDNVASNALCRRLGFAFLGEVEVEYPKGSLMRSSDWRLELRGAPAAAAEPPQSGGEAEP